MAADSRANRPRKARCWGLGGFSPELAIVWRTYADK